MTAPDFISFNIVLLVITNGPLFPGANDRVPAVVLNVGAPLGLPECPCDLTTNPTADELPPLCLVIVIVTLLIVLPSRSLNASPKNQQPLQSQYP